MELGELLEIESGEREAAEWEVTRWSTPRVREAMRSIAQTKPAGTERARLEKLANHNCEWNAPIWYIALGKARDERNPMLEALIRCRRKHARQWLRARLDG